MSEGFSDDSINDITEVLRDYFDGLHDGDLEEFARIFHPNAHLYATDGETITDWAREEYFEIIRGRQSASERGLARHDKILSIHKAGPNTALAIVNCAMPPRYFTDYLTLIRVGGRWQINSKTFHTDTHE